VISSQFDEPLFGLVHHPDDLAEDLFVRGVNFSEGLFGEFPEMSD
jgi:hypothetical protein